MKLIYLSKNLNRYSVYEQFLPPYKLEIGEKNKRGQTLLYAIFVAKDKMFVVNSWDEYYNICYRLYKMNMFGHLSNFKKGVKNRFAYKLIKLAYKIKQ